MSFNTQLLSYLSLFLCLFLLLLVPQLNFFPPSLLLIPPSPLLNSLTIPIGPQIVNGNATKSFIVGFSGSSVTAGHGENYMISRNILKYRKTETVLSTNNLKYIWNITSLNELSFTFVFLLLSDLILSSPLLLALPILLNLFLMQIISFEKPIPKCLRMQ